MTETCKCNPCRCAPVCNCTGQKPACSCGAGCKCGTSCACGERCACGA